MPVQSVGHVQYWNKGDGVLQPLRLSKGGYPSWQSAVIMGSLFGVLQRGWDRLGWWIAWLRRLWRWSAAERAWLDAHVDAAQRLPEEGQLVLRHTLDALQHPAMPQARQAVRNTAVILGFNQAQAWVRLSHALHERNDWAENSWRHLQAMRDLDAAYPGLTNPQKNLLVELGYVGFALKPR